MYILLISKEIIIKLNTVKCLVDLTGKYWKKIEFLKLPTYFLSSAENGRFPNSVACIKVTFGNSGF